MWGVWKEEEIVEEAIEVAQRHSIESDRERRKRLVERPVYYVEVEVLDTSATQGEDMR